MVEVTPENLEWSNGCDTLSRAGTDLANEPTFFQKQFPICSLQPPFLLAFWQIFIQKKALDLQDKIGKKKTMLAIQ
jgi:hypothetical protein